VDIIFGGSSHVLVSNFQEIIENEFQISMMGELTFFLGIQVKQMKQGTFVHQAKYMMDLMKKFNMAELKPVSTLMSTATVLDLDKNGEAVDQREYRSMIGSLLYLMVTRPNIQFVVCLCACFQASPRSSIEQLLCRFLGILNTHSNLGFGIPLLRRLTLLAFYADFVGCGIDQKSSSGTLLVCSQIIFCCTIHHKGQVCSRC
jgi:hypothetical protein